MDIPKLPLTLLESGRQFDQSLRGLGLRADGLTWVWDFQEEEFHLFLFWAGVEQHGPLNLAELLFKAYKSSKLPHSLDPFSIRMFSDKHPFWPELHAHLESGLERTQMHFFQKDQTTRKMLLHIQGDWIISMHKKRRSRVEINKDWKRFNAAVNSLAA